MCNYTDDNQIRVKYFIITKKEDMIATQRDILKIYLKYETWLQKYFTLKQIVGVQCFQPYWLCQELFASSSKTTEASMSK